MTDKELEEFNEWKKSKEDSEAKKLIPGMPVVKESQNLTVEKMKSFLPKGTGAKLTQAIVDDINKIEDATGLPQEYMEEKIMSNMHMLGGSGITVEKLVNATKYANLCEHYTNKKAWQITFPAKYDKLEKAGKFIDSHVSMFENSALVVEIKKQMMIPMYVTYKPFLKESIMKLVNLSRGKGATDDDRVSAHVQMLSASKIVDILQMPEDNTIELKIGASDAVLEQQAEMNTHLASLVASQSAAFRAGGKAIDVQKVHLKITSDEEIIDV